MPKRKLQHCYKAQVFSVSKPMHLQRGKMTVDGAVYIFLGTYFGRCLPTNNVSFDCDICGSLEATSFKKYLAFIRESLQKSKDFPFLGIMAYSTTV